MKMIAADYDGTVRYRETVTPEDIASLRRWQSQGNLFVIDTGRSLESILQETERCGLHPDYYVTNNGGMAFDQDRNMLYSSYLDHVMGLDIMYIAKQTGDVVSYVVNDGIRRHRVIVNPALSEKRYPGLQPDLSEEELMRSGQFAQFVISMDTMEAASELARKINAYFPDHTAAYANKYVTDIVPKGISKATGLEFIRKLAGIPIDDVYTLGDAENDIPLMTFGKHGGCMASSPQEIRSHAAHIWNSISELIHFLSEEKERQL